jgi:hypothetical protein
MLIPTLPRSLALPRRAGDHGIGFANGATFVAGVLEHLVGDLGPPAFGLFGRRLLGM